MQQILRHLEEELERQVPDLSWKIVPCGQPPAGENDWPESIKLVPLQNGVEIRGGDFRVKAKILLRWGAAETARLISIGMCLRNVTGSPQQPARQGH